VTSLDVDAELTGRPTDLLRGHGYGRSAWPARTGARGGAAAPYDRLVAWASSLKSVPAAWVEQVRPGGVIVAPSGSAPGSWWYCGDWAGCGECCRRFGSSRQGSCH
jgi:protein-L-isoaspartate O-methyltransferase